MNGDLSFFEIGVEDAARGGTFYGGLFGWRVEPGPSGGDGFEISTPGVRGGLHGGDPAASPYLFFEVDDMDAALQRVRDLGGSVDDVDLGSDPDSVARFGRFTLCHDDQGSPFGLHEKPAS